MQQQELIEVVSQVLVSSMKLSADRKVDTQASLKDNYGLDSMSSMKFLMALEKKIPGFEVDTDTLEEHHLENIESVVGYISSAMQA